MQLIKEEAPLTISEKELPFDLFQHHLDYCKVMCELHGQIEIYHIDKETCSMKFGLSKR